MERGNPMPDMTPVDTNFCEKCGTNHTDWIDQPYPAVSMMIPHPTSRGVGCQHLPWVSMPPDQRERKISDRWWVGYNPLETDPWGVHGPMDDGRDHIYPVIWLSTQSQAIRVAELLSAQTCNRLEEVLP